MRRLGSIVLLLALLTGCGEAEPAARPAPSPSPSPSLATSPPPRPADDLRLTGIRARGERVVLTFTGTGRPHAAVRYVRRAVVDGSGDVVPLAGDRVLQLDVAGTPTRRHSRRVATSLGGAVVDAHVVGAWEGVTQVFLGLRGERRTVRVGSRTSPPRLVVTVRP